GGDPAATLPSGPGGAGAALGEFARGLRRRGAEATWLADGALLVVVEATGVATDLAARAARFALEARAADGRASAVVAVGRAEGGAGAPTGEVIDRAA